MKKVIIFLIIVASIIFFVVLFHHGGNITPKRTRVKTQEFRALQSIATAMEVYQRKHGRLPATLEEIGEVRDFENLNRMLEGCSGFPIEDYYQFLPQPIEAQYEPYHILLVRTVPYVYRKDLKQNQRAIQWRYMIVQYKPKKDGYRSGEIAASALDEGTMQRLFRKAGVTITPKPELPEVEVLGSIPDAQPVSTQKPLLYALGVFILAGIAYLFYREYKNRGK